jgi:hypothetical protein
MKKLVLLCSLLTISAYSSGGIDNSNPTTMRYKATHTILDLSNCDSDIIRDKQAIKTFISLVGKAYTFSTLESTILHTGNIPETTGYLALTNSDFITFVIRIHNATNSVHIDFINQHAYNPHSLARLACTYFKTSACNKQVIIRK